MSPLSQLLGTGWDIWALWVLGIIVFLTGGALVIMELALPELPKKPKWKDRARHKLWRSL